MSRYMPVSIDMKDKKVLVIGAGQIAYRKIEKLADYNCIINLVSKEIKEEKIKKYIENNRIFYKEKLLEEIDLIGIDIIIAATDDIEFNKYIYTKYKEKALLINSVDDVENSNFIFGANLKRGDLNILVSSSGSSPFLAVKIRDYLDKIIGQEYTKIMELLKKFRIDVKGLDIESKKKRENLKEAISEIKIGEKVSIENLKKRLKNLLPKK